MAESGHEAGAQGWTTGTYAELREVAAALLARERRAHTLAPTELVHEAWLKVRSTAARSRLALAAGAMRAALVDHARRRTARKRGEGAGPVVLVETAAEQRDSYLVALDEALGELAAADAELAQLVELRFFGGLPNEAVARELALSPRTVKRRWLLAKAWLHQRIQES